MSSYAARASRRSGATSTGESKTMQTGTSVSSSRPQLHSRKHSANSAGDVFAMLGQPIGSSKAASSGGGAGSTVGGKDKERDRSLSRPQHPSIKEEDSKGDTSDAIAGPLSSRKMLSESSKGAAASSSPSSSSPSTPATSLPTTGTTTGDLGNSRTGKRYDTYYSKPDLLKLWRSQLSVKADLEELYAAFETPEQQGVHLEAGPPQKYTTQRGSHTNAEDHRHGPHERGERPIKRGEREGLGRLPPPSTGGLSSSSALPGGLPFPPNPRRTSAGAPGNLGQANLSGVFQGGVLSGVGLQPRKVEAGPPSATEGSFQRAPLSARSRIAGEKDKDRGSNSTAPATAGLTGWTSNRWRHLQADEDSHISSSGSSTKDEGEENDPWSRPHSSGESEWKPGQHDKIEQEKVALQKSLNGAIRDARPGSRSLESASWRQAEVPREVVQSTDLKTLGTEGKDTRSVVSGAADTAPSGQSGALGAKQSLFFDDLLGPTRSVSGTIGTPLSVSSSRSNSIAHSMSALALGEVGGPGSRAPSASGGGTPARAAAVEGLEVLARRSPVQEMSMAALQQQRPISASSPAPSTSSFHRPVPPTHPTTEPNERIFWQYRDPQGQLQGPFSVVQMHDWYGQGFFNDTLLVKRVESTDFETLGALIIRLHDVHLPFFSAPYIKNVYAPPPPPPGLGQGTFGLGQPPQRGTSPAIWDQPRPSPYGAPQDPFSSGPQSQPQGSRTTSFSSGNAVFDLFSKAQMRRSESPDVTFPPSVSATLPSVDSSNAAAEGAFSSAPDPWADMTTSKPAQSSSLRGLSALGGEPVNAEPFRRSPSGHHLPHIGTNALRQESIPSPIGRSASSTAIKEAANPSSPLKEPPVDLPTVQSKAQKQGLDVSEASATAKAVPAGAVPAKAVAATSKSNADPGTVTPQVAPKAPVSPAKSERKAALAATTAPASVQAPAPARAPSASASASAAPTSTPTSTASKAGVGLISQAEFEKRKKAPAAQSPVNEVTIDALTGKDTSNSSTAVPRKVAPWAKSGDDNKVVEQEASVLPKSSSGLSLREIQAKEQKETEARRAREKKALAAHLAAEEAAAAERRAKEAAEGLPVSARWGDAPASSPNVATASTNASPWAKPAPAQMGQSSVTGKSAAGKKTLKEIQEEEEARSRAAARAQSAQAMKLSKGYSTSVGQAPPTFSATSDGPWQTVGIGKPVSPAPITPSTRPSVSNGLPSTASPAASARPTTAPLSLAAKLASQNVKAVPAASPIPLSRSTSSLNAGRNQTNLASATKDDENAFPASADLLKWCKEALTGLDIPIDDFVQMLLSFPVPLDKSTRELISDSVYASSRTLDGRHFSDAFADKRLADTKSIKMGKATPVSAAAYLSSMTTLPSSSRGNMADAIKFIPAQKQPEMNFKVVTKTKGKKK